MVRWIVSSSLRFQRLVLAASLALLALGINHVVQAPVAALPEFGPPTVEVQTEALGLSAAEVEQLVTAPLEQDLLVGIPFLEEIESVSLPGLSSVVMTFEPDTDLLDARQVVQERLSQAVGVAGLPAVAKAPQMLQPRSANSRVSMVKLTSEELTPIEMSVLARWVIGPRLLGVGGVANVAIWGNRDRQLQVLVDPDRLRDQDVTLAQVIRTAGNALEVSQLSFLEASTPGTGGFIDTANQRLNIFHEQAISTPAQLAGVPLEDTSNDPGGPATLGTVAEVVEDHQPLIGDASCSGSPRCLLMVIERFPDVDSGTVSADVDETLAALGPGLGDMEIDSSVYRPAAYVEQATGTLGWAATAGAILLVGLLLVFLWSWRRVAIAVGTIGVAVSAAVVVLAARDAPVNLLAIAGLMIGLTVVVADVAHHVPTLASTIRAHRQNGVDRSLVDAVTEASASTHRGLVYATLIVAAAAVPLLLLGGVGGAFLPQVVGSYLLAAAISVLVTLVVTPALAMLLLSSGTPDRGRSPAVAWLRRGHDRVLPRLLARGRPVAAAVALLALLAVGTLPFLDLSLRPALKERNLIVQVAAPAGTSLTRMTDLTERAVADLAALPEVRTANAHVGRAVMSDQTTDVDRGQIWVALEDEAAHDGTRSLVQQVMDGYPELETSVTAYTDDRVRRILEPEEHDVLIRLYGDDGQVLADKAEEVRDTIAGVDGVTGATVETGPVSPTLEIEVDLDRAQAQGLKPGDVRRAAASLLGGITVGNLFEEQKVFDVVVWARPELRTSEANLQDLLVDAPDGSRVRLGDVAEVRTVPNASVIRHESVARYLQVTAEVSGRDVAAVNSDVRALVRELSYPLDHHAEVLPGFADREAATGRLLGIGAAALLAIALLLQAALGSWRLAGASLLVLPLAISGGLVAVLAQGGTVTLGTVLGLLTVLGLATRGLILLVRHLQDVERHSGQPLDLDSVVRATGDRVAPQLVAVLGAAVLVAPLAVMGTSAGLEVLHPAALTVLGGLVTTVLVTVLVVPLLYVRLGGSRQDSESWADELFDPVREPSHV